MGGIYTTKLTGGLRIHLRIPMYQSITKNAPSKIQSKFIDPVLTMLYSTTQSGYLTTTCKHQFGSMSYTSLADRVPVQWLLYR